MVKVTADFGHIDFNAAARTWSWTYNSTDDLNRTVTITATDDSNASTDVSFTLNVNNAPPLFEAGADETLPTGSGEFSRTNITFTDPGQLDQHTLTVDFGDGSVPQTVDLTTGIRSFDLNYTYVSSGTFNVVVTVADGDGGSIQDSFEVTVNLEIFYDFTSATFNTPENGTTNVVLVTRSGATNIASSVEVVLTGLTATAGSDFAADPILLEFAADEITKAVPVTLFNEAVVEDNETIGLSFDNFSLGGLNGVNSTAVLTIDNDDSASLNISAPTIIETDGNQTAVFTVTLDNAVQGGFDVAHALSLGTADSNDLLVQTTTPLRFDGLAGETRSIAVQINGDNVVEADESFTITLGVVDAASAVQTANITTGAAAQGVIVNDDAAPVANASGPYSIVEGSELELNAGNSTDADDTFAGLTFRWDIDGDGDFDENITGATPTISAAELIALGLGNGLYSGDIILEASDGTNVSTTTVSLTVNNAPPVLNDVTFEVLENSGNGTVVGTLIATDAGQDSLTYAITGGTGLAAFAIDPTTGVITIADET